MNVSLDEARLGALIRQRMASGLFQNVEELLLKALESAPFPQTTKQASSESADSLLPAPLVENAPIELKTSRKSLAQLFRESPFKGMEMEFPRDESPMRNLDL